MVQLPDPYRLVTAAPAVDEYVRLRFGSGLSRRTRAPRGAYVSLTADPPGRKLYASRGFAELGAGDTGMHLFL